MKLDDWAMQFHILEINKILRPEYRWPRLDDLLAALESLPRLSIDKYGSGIFIGWGGLSSEWRYHHTICIPSRHINGCRYGYIRSTGGQYGKEGKQAGPVALEKEESK